MPRTSMMAGAGALQTLIFGRTSSTGSRADAAAASAVEDVAVAGAAAAAEAGAETEAEEAAAAAAAAEPQPTTTVSPPTARTPWAAAAAAAAAGAHESPDAAYARMLVRIGELRAGVAHHRTLLTPPRDSISNLDSS